MRLHIWKTHWVLAVLIVHKVSKVYGGSKIRVSVLFLYNGVSSNCVILTKIMLSIFNETATFKTQIHYTKDDNRLV